jgi:hypothetical protein
LRKPISLLAIRERRRKRVIGVKFFRTANKDGGVAGKDKGRHFGTHTSECARRLRADCVFPEARLAFTTLE